MTRTNTPRAHARKANADRAKIGRALLRWLAAKYLSRITPDDHSALIDALTDIQHALGPHADIAMVADTARRHYEIELGEAGKRLPK